MSPNLQREVLPWEARVEGKPAGPSVASQNIPSAPRATYHKVVPISSIFRGFKFFVETVRDEDKRFRKDPQLIEAIKANGGRLCPVPTEDTITHILIASGDPGTYTFPIPPKRPDEPEHWTASELIAKFGRTEHASGKVWVGPKIVLRKEWIEDCVRAGKTLGERDYECKCIPRTGYRGKANGGGVWGRDATSTGPSRSRYVDRSPSPPRHGARPVASPVHPQRHENAYQDSHSWATDNLAARQRRGCHGHTADSGYSRALTAASPISNPMDHYDRPTPQEPKRLVASQTANVEPEYPAPHPYLHYALSHHPTNSAYDQHSNGLSMVPQPEPAAPRYITAHEHSVPPAQLKATRSTGVFTNSLGLPLSFHVLCPASLRNTLHVLIKTLGKGEIVTLQEATILVLACTPATIAEIDPDTLRLAQSELAGKRSRAAVSHEWIDKCCEAEQLVNMEEYRLDLDAIATPTASASAGALGRLAIGTSSIQAAVPPTPASSHGRDSVAHQPSAPVHARAPVHDPRHAHSAEAHAPRDPHVPRERLRPPPASESSAPVSTTAHPFVHPSRLNLVPHSPQATHSSLQQPSHDTTPPSPRTAKAYQFLQSRSDPPAGPASRAPSVTSQNAAFTSSNTNVDEWLSRSHDAAFGQPADDGGSDHKRPRLSAIEQNAATSEHGSVDHSEKSRVQSGHYLDQQRQQSLSAEIAQSVGSTTDYAALQEQLSTLFKQE